MQLTSYYDTINVPRYQLEKCADFELSVPHGIYVTLYTASHLRYKSFTVFANQSVILTFFQ